jgi:hypothetical protein
MNILLNHEAPMSLPIRLFRSRLAKYAAEKVGDRLRVPLQRFIDFKAAYQEDRGLLDAKKKDPLYVWSYGLKSYHSVFNYVPPKASAANMKPVLIAFGEHDEIVGAEHCRACFERIGGAKDFFMMPGGGHQLMLFDTSVYGRVIDSWIRERVLGGAQSWEPPIEPEERRYFEFLDRERANDAAGEPELCYPRPQPVHLALFRHDRTAVRVRPAPAESRLSPVPRPAELNTMLRDAGFELLPRRGRPTAPALVGLEYKAGMNPFSVKRSVRDRALGDEIFKHTEPRWWLGNGFVGEYVGSVQKPLHTVAV